MVVGKQTINTMPLSRETLLARGKCCHHGCKNCPYKENNMKKTTKNKTVETTKKKIHFVYLDGDRGELWLDEKLKPLSWVHANDAIWRDEYHNFIIEYLGGELVDMTAELEHNITNEDRDSLDEADCLEAIYDIVKKYI